MMTLDKFFVVTFTLFFLLVVAGIPLGFYAVGRGNQRMLLELGHQATFWEALAEDTGYLKGRLYERSLGGSHE